MPNCISSSQRGWSGKIPSLPLLGFLVFFYFFFGFLVMHTCRTSGLNSMIYTSFDVPCKDVPFGGCVDTASQLEGQIAQKLQFWGAQKGVSKPNLLNIQTFIL